MAQAEEERFARYSVPSFASLEDARGIYGPPQGCEWRPVVIDALNFLAKEVGPEWYLKGYGGTCMARFAAFLINIGVKTVKFILSRAIVDLLVSKDPNRITRRDRSDFVWLLTHEYIVVAPSWMTLDDITAAANKSTVLLEQLRLPVYSRSGHNTHNSPWKVNDDLITLHLCYEMEAVVVSSDKFRDLKVYLPDSPLAYMHRVLRTRQVTATLVDAQENVWRLDPMYGTACKRTDLPFWMPVNSRQEGIALEASRGLENSSWG